MFGFVVFFAFSYSSFAAPGNSLTAHYSGAQTTVGVGLSGPCAVAVDAHGNVYIADTYNSRVVKVPWTGTGYGTQITIGTGLSFPFGVAVDSNLNVYIADTGNARILEVPWNGNSYDPQVAIYTYTGEAYATLADVAVDLNSNVYFSDNENNWVLMLPYSGPLNFGSPVLVVGSMNGPWGISVDNAGTVYATDSWWGYVETAQWNGTGYTIGTVLGEVWDYPYGVATDANRNVYVAEFGNFYSTTDVGRVRVTYKGNPSYTSPVNFGSGFSRPRGLAVDGQGNVYVADYGHSRVVKVQAVAANFGSVAVGNTSAVLSISFTFDSSGSLNSSTPYQVLTQGAPGLDFADAGTGTCTTNGANHSYNTGDSCTVDVNFSPKFAGLRSGAVVLMDTNGNVVATGYLYGIGTAPQMALSPAIQSTLASGFGGPGSVAVDGYGNVFIADTTNNQVEEFPWTASGYLAPNPVGVNLSKPGGVAVDGAGNVYIADSGNQQIVRVPRMGSSFGGQTTVAQGFFNPTSVAVDASGNVYIADAGAGHQSVTKVGWTGNAYGNPSPVASGFSNPVGVAVDGSGNVFVADTTKANVMEVPWTGTVYGTPVPVGSGFSSPAGVAVDGSANLYVAAGSDSSVFRVPWTGTVYGTPVPVGSGFSSPAGVAVDASGNVYVSDATSKSLSEVGSVAPQTLTFAATPVGSMSSDSPHSVAVENIGNAPLTFSIPVSGDNPSVPAGFALDSSTTCPELSTYSSTPGSLGQGQSCTYAVDFIPGVPGSASGSMSVMDNNRNGVGADHGTQSVGLSGTGLAVGSASVSPTSLALGTYVIGVPSSAKTLKLTSTGTANLNNLTITMVGTNWTDFQQTNNCPISLTPGAYCTIHVTYTPGILGAESATLNIADSAANSPQTVGLSGKGEEPASLSVTSLNFGNVAENSASASKTVTLYNNSQTTSLSIASINTNNLDFGESDNCIPSVLAKSHCTITITLTPSGPGSDTGQLTVNDSASNTPQTASLTGNGVPQATLTPTSLTFGYQTVGTTSAAKNASLWSNLTAAMTISSITFTGNNPGDFAETDTCDGSLGAKDHCTISVTFKPQAKGTRTAYLVVTDTAGTGSQSIPLKGTGK
jgi:hypothetical protein